jgi:hypothetical protein
LCLRGVGKARRLQRSGEQSEQDDQRGILKRRQINF